MPRVSQLVRKTAQLYRREIWQANTLQGRSPRAWLYAALRVISITLTVFAETKAASRAAALTFSSLLGLGPLVAIAVLVAGFVLNQNDPNLAVNTLNKLITFIAPQISEYEKLSTDGRSPAQADASRPRSDVVTATTLRTPPPPAGAKPAPPSDHAKAPAPAPGTTHPSQAPPDGKTTIAVNPELVQLINGFISGSRSGAAGVIGALTLIVIVLQLFTSVENSFNEIWGVRRGRSWLMRIVLYWTVLTLGAVIFFAAVTLLGAGTFINVFFEKLPFGLKLLNALHWMQIFSVALLIAILTLFYRCIPNTHVLWRAAFIGAAVVAALLVLNNFLAFFYFRRVILSKSLYGSLGILPILMLGLYVFWLFVLVGGQISYAVQNVHFRNSQAAWGNLSGATRERLSLLVLLTICRRFQACLPPTTATQLGNMIKVPTQILNECLNRLVDLKLITPIPPAPGAPATDFFYQPSRPLDRITLGEFKRRFERYGDDPAGDSIDRLDPLARAYRDRLDTLIKDDYFNAPLDRLLRDHHPDESRPPFAFGEPR